MPMKAMRPCSIPGCPALVSSGRCAQHQLAAPKDERPSAAARGYGTDWRKLRVVILRRDPVCRLCKQSPSRHVDHIISREGGGSDRPSNLQGTCARCHSRKTAAHDGGFGNRKKMVHG